MTTTFSWTLEVLRAAPERLLAGNLSPDERARLEELFDLAPELEADAAALTTRPA